MIQVVEELGDKASGDYAELCIVTMNDDAYYRITEYDGYESVELRDEIEWDF